MYVIPALEQAVEADDDSGVLSQSSLSPQLTDKR
jgi:hypothetical protein